jgi:uncharacterized membrane protein
VSKGRLEAFSDAVIAIVMTIMVLELRAPHETGWTAVQPLLPTLASYALSFVFLAIYWNNHHHLLQACRHVTGAALWANMHLLFWLSLTPFVTAWMGESHFAPRPVAIYGMALLLAAIAYYILTRALLGREGPNSLLARALGADVKGKVSVALYVIAILLALFASPLAAGAIYVAVAVMWLIPDRRIERVLEAEVGGSRSALER